MNKVKQYLLRRLKDQKGVALILTFIFMISLIIVVSSYLYLVTVETRNATGQSNNIQALYLAESALNHAIYYLTNEAPDETTDGSWRTDDYPTDPGPGDTDPQQETLAPGKTYTMWVQETDPVSSEIIVTGRGTVGGIVRVMQEMITLTVTSSSSATEYASYSDGDIDFDDSTGTVTGDLATTGTVDDEEGMTITGTITESSGIEATTVTSSSYEAIADTTISGNRTFSAGTYSGIYYVDGKVTINDNVTFNGTIVATGNIVLTNTDNFVSTPTSNYPALVSDATITGNRMGSSTINGLVFGASAINFPRGSSNTINGSLISGGDISLNDGSWTITYDSDLDSDPPPYFTFPSGTASVTATGANWDEISNE